MKNAEMAESNRFGNSLFIRKTNLSKTVSRKVMGKLEIETYSYSIMFLISVQFELKILLGMIFLSLFERYMKLMNLRLTFTLKELRNCILRIILVWSLFCSIQIYLQGRIKAENPGGEGESKGLNSYS